MQKQQSFGVKDPNLSLNATLERYKRLGVPATSATNGFPVRPQSAQGNNSTSPIEQPEVPSSVIAPPEEHSLPVRPQSTVPLSADVRQMLSFAHPSVPYAARSVSSAGMSPFKCPNYINHHRPYETSAAVKRFSALRSPSLSSSADHSIHQNGFNHKNDAHDDRLNCIYEKMDIGVMTSSTESGGSNKGLQQDKVPNGFQDLHSGTEGKTSSSGYETSSSSSFFRRFVQIQQTVAHNPPEIRVQTEAQTVTQLQAESEPEPDTQNTVTENVDPRTYFSRSSASSCASDYSSNSRSSTQVNHVESGMKALAITPGLNGLSTPIPQSFESNEGTQNGYATFALDGSAVYVSGPTSSSPLSEVHLEGETSGKRSLVLEREMKEVGVGTEPHVEQNCYWFGKTHPKLIQSYKKGDILRVHVANTILDPKHLFLVHDEDLTFDAKIKEMSEQMKAREEWQIRFREPPALDSVVCARCPSRNYEWYRGIVFAQQAASVSVFFVDIGETAKVWLDDLRAMFKSVIDVPRQSVFVELEGIDAVHTGYYSDETIAITRNQALQGRNFRLIVTDVRGHDMWGKLYLETTNGGVGLPVSELYKQFGITDMKKEDLN